MNNEKTFPLDSAFLTLAQKYLSTAQNIFKKMVEGGNSCHNPYNESQPIWDDREVMLPALFIFFHGIEISMKGLLFIKTKEKKDIKSIINKNHRIDKLFSEIKKEYKKEEELVKILEKYSYFDSEETPEFIKKFIDNNNNINNLQDLYVALRYPTDTEARSFYNYLSTKYQEDKGIIFAKEIIEDIDSLLKEMVKIYRGSEK